MILLHEFLHAHGFVGAAFLAAQRDAIRTIRAGKIRSGREGHLHYCDGGDLLAWLRRYRVRGLDFEHEQFLCACDAAEADEAAERLQTVAAKMCAENPARSREERAELARNLSTIGLRQCEIAKHLGVDPKVVAYALREVADE